MDVTQNTPDCEVQWTLLLSDNADCFSFNRQET